MQSVGASPETTAAELIARVGELCARATSLAAGALAAAEPETLCAALSNVADGLMEASAALRAMELTAEVLARARRAGEAEGYERGLEDGRREGHAGRRAKARHLALIARAAS